MKDRNKWIHFMVWAILIMSCIVTRCWRVTTIPSGIHIDEAAMAYDAWCLSEYGVDRYLKSWPVYLNNFGGGQSSLYAFLCVAFIKVLGFNMWSIRLPAILSSMGNVIFGVLIAKRIWGKENFLSYGVGVLLVLCPYFIMAGRFGLDCNLMLGVSNIFLYYFICALEDDKWGYYLVAGIAGGILLYTYALTYIILPAFLLVMVIYLVYVKKLSFEKWTIMAIPLTLLAFPLILVQIVNIFDLQEFQLERLTITKLDYYRASEMHSFQLEGLQTVIRSIFFHDELTHNSIEGRYNLFGITGILFLIGLVFVITKIYKSIAERCFEKYFILFLWFFCIALYGCHISGNVNRLNGIFSVVILIAYSGIVVLLGDSRNRVRNGIVLGVVGAMYLCSFLEFAVYYYGGKYTAEMYPLSNFDVEVSEGIDFIESDEVLRQRETYMAEHAIYYAISALPSPYDLQWAGANMSSYGNYHFSSLPEIDMNTNYLVHQIFGEYAADLRERGFEEVWFGNYWLFYNK